MKRRGPRAMYVLLVEQQHAPQGKVSEGHGEQKDQE